MIINIEMYNNHIRAVRDFSLTATELEETIKQYPYTGERRVKDPKVENSQLPPIALCFYWFVYECGTVPSPDDLIKLYLSQACFRRLSEEEYEVTYGADTFVVSTDGLIARILRTYPSILRDIHFYLLAVESKLFQAVRYSFEDDFKNGVDIKVQYNGKWFNIALMQNTRRALFFRSRKKSRHTNSNMDLINVELDPTKSKRCGDYNLYTMQHVEMVKKMIMK